MIVETMTCEEICREYDKIHREFYAKLEIRLDWDSHTTSKIRRYLLAHKNARDVLFKPIKFKVDESTNYYAIPKIPDLKFFEKNGPSAMTFLTHTNSQGVMAVMRMGYHDDEYFFATRHFFDRFIERFLKEEVSKTEAICQFFANNTNFVMTPFPIQDNPNNLIGIADEVVFFGESISPKILLVKTCITREMLHSGQFDARDLLDESIKLVLKDREILKALLMNPATSHLNRYKFV